MPLFRETGRVPISLKDILFQKRSSSEDGPVTESPNSILGSEANPLRASVDCSCDASFLARDLYRCMSFRRLGERSLSARRFFRLIQKARVCRVFSRRNIQGLRVFCESHQRSKATPSRRREVMFRAEKPIRERALWSTIGVSLNIASVWQLRTGMRPAVSNQDKHAAFSDWDEIDSSARTKSAHPRLSPWPTQYAHSLQGAERLWVVAKHFSGPVRMSIRACLDCLITTLGSGKQSGTSDESREVGPNETMLIGVLTRDCQQANPEVKVESRGGYHALVRVAEADWKQSPSKRFFVCCRRPCSVGDVSERPFVSFAIHGSFGDLKWQ